MYSIVELKSEIGNLEDEEIKQIKGFMMSSSSRIFKINGCNIRKIKIVNKKLAYPLVSKKVLKKYEKLINYLTELLLDDDDTGDSLRIALNQIEKFRLEVKNKYRLYLKKKELAKMSKQLLAIQKEAQKQLLIIQNSFIDEKVSSRRGK